MKPWHEFALSVVGACVVVSLYVFWRVNPAAVFWGLVGYVVFCWFAFWRR